MLRDALLSFVGPTPLSLVLGLGVGAATDPYDVLGVGPGNAPPGIIGNATLFGSDLGVGAFKNELVVIVGTAFTTSDSATLRVQFQAAPDAGTPTYQPGTWVTLEQTADMTAAQLVANTYVARFSWPPVFPMTLRPRFYRLNFFVAAATQFTAGTISNAFITTVRDDYSMAQASRNYTVS